jgi:hypothetical protein
VSSDELKTPLDSAPRFWTLETRILCSLIMIPTCTASRGATLVDTREIPKSYLTLSSLYRGTSRPRKMHAHRALPVKDPGRISPRTNQDLAGQLSNMKNKPCHFTVSKPARSGRFCDACIEDMGGMPYMNTLCPCVRSAIEPQPFC